jgi:DNA-binding protein HU-beta
MPPAKKSTSRATRSRSSTSRATRSRAASSRTTRSRASGARKTSARKTTARGTNSPFKEPAALKRLSKSLESATSALSDLQKQSGRDVGKGARDLYKDLRSFLSNASRHSGRLGTALKRDFDQAQKSPSKPKARAKSTRSSRTRGSTSRAKSSTGTRRRAASGTRRSATRSASRTSRTSRASR